MCPLHRRNPAPTDYPKQPPLLLLLRGRGLTDQHLRRDNGVPLAHRFRIRFGQRHFGHKRAAAVGLHRLVPFLPARHRRSAETLLQTPRWGPWRSPTSTSCWWPAAPSVTSDLLADKSFQVHEKDAERGFMVEVERHSYNVVVIGAGGAGLRA